MRTKKDFDKQNEYNKDKYDRLGVMLPKGSNEVIDAYCKANEISKSALVKMALDAYMTTPIRILKPNKKYKLIKVRKFK